MVKRCKNCGDEFTPSKRDDRIVYCCRECRLGYNRKTEAYKKYYVTKKRKPEKSALAKTALEAKQHGMSYGKYIVWRANNEN